MEPSEIKRRYRQFADLECKDYSAAYYALALAVTEDDDVVEFIAAMPVTQPNLFFASIQLLTGPEGMPGGGSALRAFVKARGREVVEVMRARRTQTNEVGRCAVLLPALPPGPLALVEVGASAGLCLLLDRFSYELGSTAIGNAASPVHLRCAVAGPVPLPATVPRVVWRRGLDLNPVNLGDEDAIRWLLACVWPDHPDRRRRLEAAIGLARREPPTVTAGDLVDDLPPLLAEAPEGAQLVVFHSAVLSYVSQVRREAFAAVLARVAMTANTPHIVFDEIVARSPVPLVSIVEVCAEEARRRGLRRMALLGTRFTMDAPFYRSVCARHGVAAAAGAPGPRARRRRDGAGRSPRGRVPNNGGDRRGLGAGAGGTGLARGGAGAAAWRCA